GAVDVIAATVDAGASPAEARAWWVSNLAQEANTRGVELGDLPSRLSRWPRSSRWCAEGTLTNKMARSVVEGVLTGEGEPADVVEKRGPEGGFGRLGADRRGRRGARREPGHLDKIRSGKVQAAGKVVGDVMRATKGQANAKRVQELVLERANA
ncbi:Asp-tRNA(Asn)/Glu-tRNA(Gln) amidotransferase GatCAB subunit B, partial [Kibdelosporangium philippinense]